LQKQQIKTLTAKIYGPIITLLNPFGLVAKKDHELKISVKDLLKTLTSMNHHHTIF